MRKKILRLTNPLDLIFLSLFRTTGWDPVTGEFFSFYSYFVLLLPFPLTGVGTPNATKLMAQFLALP